MEEAIPLFIRNERRRAGRHLNRHQDMQSARADVMPAHSVSRHKMRLICPIILWI